MNETQKKAKEQEAARRAAEGFPGDATYPEVHELEGKFLALVTDPTQVVDAAEVSRSIMQRIVDADDFDAALDMADQGALSTADVAECPFTILELSWHKGSPQFAENSVGVFALMTVELHDDKKFEGKLLFPKGSKLPITTGANNVLAALYKGATSGRIPGDTLLRFVPRNTSSGYTTYWLARA